MDSSTRQPRWRQIAYGLLGGGFGACVDANFTVKLYPAAPCPGGHTPLALSAPLTDAELAELQKLAAAADPLFAKQKRSLRRVDRLLAGSGKLDDGEIRNLMEEFNRRKISPRAFPRRPTTPATG